MESCITNWIAYSKETPVFFYFYMQYLCWHQLFIYLFIHFGWIWNKLWCWSLRFSHARGVPELRVIVETFKFLFDSNLRILIIVMINYFFLYDLILIWFFFLFFVSSFLSGAFCRKCQIILKLLHCWLWGNVGKFSFLSIGNRCIILAYFVDGKWFHLLSPFSP